MSMKSDTYIIDSPIGPIIATADDHGITSLDFTDEALQITNSTNPLLLRLEIELREYFAGNRQIFTLPLNPHGTPFQTRVWEILRTISYGETISYAEEAKLFGNPKAVRAAASANAKNPISILIPCHRVIATGGGLGGYSGGLWRKEFLLDLEKTEI